MAVRSNVLTVGTTATLVLTGNDTDSNQSFRDGAVKNTGSVVIYLGGPDVSTTNGFPLAAGETMTFDDIAPDSMPYAMVATGTSTLAVMQVGV